MSGKNWPDSPLRLTHIGAHTWNFDSTLEKQKQRIGEYFEIVETKFLKATINHWKHFDLVWD